MRAGVFLLALALCAVSAQAATNAWYIKASAYQANRWLAEGHDVRAFLLDGVIVYEQNGHLPPSTARRVSLGAIADEERLAVLEKGRDKKLFSREVAELVKNNGVRLLSPNSFPYAIVALTGETVEDLIYNLVDSEAIMVSRSPLTPTNNARLRRRLRSKYTAIPEIESLISLLNEEDAYDIATYLSGESAESPFGTRHSTSEDAPLVGDWVEDMYATYGFSTWREYFRSGYCSNVVGEILGSEEPDSIVILGAHLDDRNANIANSTGRAPGANDDGSGSTMLLLSAKALFASGMRFRRTIRIMNYCGEEQGLYGSEYHAAEAVANRLDIYAMLQGDMIAVQNPGDNIGVALVNRYTDPTLTAIVQGYVAAYVPELEISSQSACCSDHQPFFEHGYASAGFVEPSGYVGDPKYHDVEDVVNRSDYNIRQLVLTAKAMLASIAELAEPI